MLVTLGNREHVGSGVRTNLKVGGTCSVQSTRKFFCRVFCRVFLQVQLVVFVSASVMVSTVWSVFVCCSSTHAPPCSAICKSGGHVPSCPMESAPLHVGVLVWLLDVEILSCVRKFNVIVVVVVRSLDVTLAKKDRYPYVHGKQVRVKLNSVTKARHRPGSPSLFGQSARQW